MAHPYSALCDDFYLNMRLGSQLALPNQRDTVLHFFEQMQKAYPKLTKFRKGEGHDYSLEEDRENADSYRWVSLEANRVSAGHVNPDDLEHALKLHALVLERVPYELGVSSVEIDYLDMLIGFDLDYAGNHDEVVAESLYESSPLAALMDIDKARPVDFQPTATVAITDDARLQVRMDIVTRTSSFELRTGEYNEEPISVYLIVRRFWGDRPDTPLHEMARELAERAERIATDLILPRVVKPISSAIAARGS